MKQGFLLKFPRNNKIAFIALIDASMRADQNGVLEIVKKMIDAGEYKMVPVLSEPVQTSEEFFDWANMKLPKIKEDEPGMNFGDIILWNNGQRELCLEVGWTNI